MGAVIPREKVVQVLADADPGWAREAQSAWDWITAGGDMEDVGLHDVQTFLWYGLPAKWSGSGARIRHVADSLARRVTR